MVAKKIEFGTRRRQIQRTINKLALLGKCRHAWDPTSSQLLQPENARQTERTCGTSTRTIHLGARNTQRK